MPFVSSRVVLQAMFNLWQVDEGASLPQLGLGRAAGTASWISFGTSMKFGFNLALIVHGSAHSWFKHISNRSHIYHQYRFPGNQIHIGLIEETFRFSHWDPFLIFGDDAKITHIGTNVNYTTPSFVTKHI